MAAVDEKPTYRSADALHCLRFLARSGAKRACDALIKSLGTIGKHDDLIVDFTAPTDYDEVIGEAEDGFVCSLAAASEYFDISAEDFGSREVLVERKFDELLASWFSEAEQVVHGSDVSFQLAKIFVKSGGSGDLNSVAYCGAAAHVASAGAPSSKMNLMGARETFTAMSDHMRRYCKSVESLLSEAYKFTHHTFNRKQYLAMRACLPATARAYTKMASLFARMDEVPHRCIVSDRTLPDGSKVELIPLGASVLMRRENKVYIAGKDNWQRLYHLIKRYRNLLVYVSLKAVACHRESTISVSMVKAAVHDMYNSVESYGDATKICKALHTQWYSEFITCEENAAQVARQKTELDAEAITLWPQITKVRNLVKDLSSNDRLNFLRIHHVFCSEDIDLNILIQRTLGQKDRVHKPDSAAWARFIRFCRSYQLCAYLRKNLSLPNVVYEGAEGPGWVNKPWAKRALAGHFALPPEDEWGLVRIHAQFDPVDHVSYHAFWAKDASRVPDDIELVSKLNRGISRTDGNELLAALRYGTGPRGRPAKTMEQMKVEFHQTGRRKAVPMDCSGKAENTKAALKPRSIFAAAESFRHPNAEVDRNSQLQSDLVGCASIRADAVAHEVGMVELAANTASGYMTSSHDIEDWSGAQHRDSWMMYVSDVMDQFRGWNVSGLKEKWSLLTAVVNKGGAVQSKLLNDSGFQGFAGTIDSQLHVQLLMLFIYDERNARMVSSRDTALAKATIDDCVSQFKNYSGTADVLHERLAAHYEKHGYRLDHVKSVTSNKKAIYLNRAFLLGGEVVQDLKVAIKVGRDEESRAQTVFDDIGAFISGWKSVAGHGGNLLCCYYLACLSAVQQIMYSIPAVRSMDIGALTAFMMADRGHYGWAFPSLSQFMTKDHPDQLSACWYAITSYVKAELDAGSQPSATFMRAVNGMLLAPVGRMGVQAVMGGLQVVSKSDVPQIEALRKFQLKKALVKWRPSEPYKSLLSDDSSEELHECYARLLSLSEGGIDARFLRGFHATLPERLLDALYGKMCSTTVLVEVLGSHELVKLERSLKFMAAELVRAQKACMSSFQDQDAMGAAELALLTGFEIATSERDKACVASGVNLVHHTEMDPFEAIVQVAAGDPASGEIAFDGTSLVAFSGGSGMDGLRSAQGIFRAFRSESPMLAIEDAVRHLDPVSAKITAGASYLVWAEQCGYHIEAWSAIWKTRWFGDLTPKLHDLAFKKYAGKIQRSGLVSSTHTHPVFFGRNWLRSCRVDVSNLVAVITESDLNLDPMAFVCSCYAAAGTMALIAETHAGREFVRAMVNSWSIAICPSAQLNEVFCPSGLAVSPDVVLEYFSECASAVPLSQLVALAPAIATSTAALSACATAASTSHGIPPPPTEKLDISVLLSGSAAVRSSALARPSVPPPRAALAIDDTYASLRALAESVAAQQKVTASSDLLYSMTSYGKPDVSEIISKVPVMQYVKALAAELNRKFSKQEVPYLVARAVQAAGCTQVGFASKIVTDYEAGLQSVATQIGSSPLNYAMLLTVAIRSRISSRPTDYARTSRAFRVVNDPLRENQRIRLENMRKRLSTNAAVYRNRATRAREGKSVKPADVSKRAYLMGIVHFCDSCELRADCTIDWQKTHESLHNANLQSWRKRTGREDTVALRTGVLGISTLARASEAESADLAAIEAPSGWNPAQYSHGVRAAASWAAIDSEHERRSVYAVAKNQLPSKADVRPSHKITYIDRVAAALVKRYAETDSDSVSSESIPEDREEAPSAEGMADKFLTMFSAPAASTVVDPGTWSIRQLAAFAESVAFELDEDEALNIMAGQAIEYVAANRDKVIAYARDNLELAEPFADQIEDTDADLAV